jgi:hypothetical protein
MNGVTQQRKKNHSGAVWSSCLCILRQRLKKSIKFHGSETQIRKLLKRNQSFQQPTALSSLSSCNPSSPIQSWQQYSSFLYCTAWYSLSVHIEKAIPANSKDYWDGISVRRSYRHLPPPPKKKKPERADIIHCPCVSWNKVASQLQLVFLPVFTYPLCLCPK